VGWRKEEADEEGVTTAWGFHYLRHFHASRLIYEGKLTLKEISEHMGHASVQITMDVYGHLFKDAEAKAERRKRKLGDRA
jgi:integrase